MIWKETGKALQSLTERVESDDYKRNKSLLDDWDRTADVRFQWTEQRPCSSVSVRRKKNWNN